MASNGYSVVRELQYEQNNKRFYKVCVKRPDGTMIPGSLSILTYPEGRSLDELVKEYTQDLRSGMYDGK